jgi:hypothetical protein
VAATQCYAFTYTLNVTTTTPCNITTRKSVQLGRSQEKIASKFIVYTLKMEKVCVTKRKRPPVTRRDNNTLMPSKERKVTYYRWHGTYGHKMQHRRDDEEKVASCYQ